MYILKINNIKSVTNGPVTFPKGISVSDQQTLLPNGSAGIPSISFINDSNTGIYSVSDGAIGFSINGTKIGEINSSGIVITQSYWNIIEQQSSGVNGHNGVTFNSGNWVTRILNTTIGNNNISGSSLSSNQINLSSGAYRIWASIPASINGLHKAVLYNVTDSINTLIGTSESTTDSSRSLIVGTFTISSSKTFEIRHRSSANGTFGTASDFGIPEVYSIVELWRLL